MIQYLQQRKWAVFWAVILFGITLVPYLMGFAIQREEWRFTGFVFGVEDGNSYIAKMMIGANGDWLFRTPYTTAPQKGMLAFLPYLLFGKLTSQPGQHEQMIALFQVFRFIGILLACLAAYDFISIYVSNSPWRRFGVVIMTVGGGLGWLSIFGLKGAGYNNLPIDLYSPETFGFLGLFGLPHLAVSRALLVWGWTRYLKPEALFKKSMVQGTVIGGLWLVMGFFQPLNVVTAWAGLGASFIVMAILSILRTRSVKKAVQDPDIQRSFLRILAAVMVSSPWVLYNLFALRLDPFLKEWTSQNIIMSPPISDYLVGFSLLLIPALIGFWLFCRRPSKEGSLLIGFIFLFPILAYLPFNLQRRLPDGIWWVLTALAITGLSALPFRWQKTGQWIMSLGTLSSIFLLMGGIFAVIHPSEPMFIPVSNVRAFQAIRHDWKVSERAVILADYQISNQIPAWLPASVFIGHGPESVNLHEIQPETEGILKASTLTEKQKQFLRDAGTDYVIISGEVPTWITEYGKIISEEDGISVFRLDIVE